MVGHHTLIARPRAGRLGGVVETQRNVARAFEAEVKSTSDASGRERLSRFRRLARFVGARARRPLSLASPRVQAAASWLLRADFAAIARARRPPVARCKQRLRGFLRVDFAAIARARRPPVARLSSQAAAVSRLPSRGLRGRFVSASTKLHRRFALVSLRAVRARESLRGSGGVVPLARSRFVSARARRSTVDSPRLSGRSARAGPARGGAAGSWFPSREARRLPPRSRATLP